MNRTVYLAGAMYGLTFAQASDWRLEVRRSLPSWEVLDPMKGKEELEQQAFIGMEYDHPLMNYRAIVDNDLFHVQQSSVILANLSLLPPIGYMTGTQIEIGYALALNKLIYVVADRGSIFSKHPFIKGKCVPFSTMDLAVTSLQNL